MSGGADSLSMLAPVGDARYATLRPTLGARRRGGRTSSPRTPGCAGTRQLAPIRDLHRAGKVTRDPRGRLRRPRTSRTSPRATTGRSASSTARPRRLDGPLPRPARRRRQPAPGPLARLQPGAEPRGRARSRSPRSRSPENYRLWTRDVWNIEARHVADQRFGALGGARRRATPSSPRRATRRARRSRCRTQLRPALDAQPGVGAARQLPGRLVRAPPRRARRDARDGPAAALRRARRQRRLRHARRPGRRRCPASSAVRAVDRRLPGRPRGARLADRVLSTSGASSAAAPRGERLGTDHGAGGLSLLIGTQARARWSASSPAWRRSTPRATCATRVDFRHVYKHVVQDWLGVDATGIMPDAAKFTTPLALFK